MVFIDCQPLCPGNCCMVEQMEREREREREFLAKDT